MAIRYYILPIEEVIIDGGTFRGPKYFSWKHDPDPPGVDARWSLMDYGLINAGLVAADVTGSQHNQVAGNDDVSAAPANIDQTINAGALPQVQATLEALRIPAGWVTTSHTYRIVLRMVGSLFQFAQRYHGMHDEELIDNTSQLDLRWDQIPTARQDRIKATADALGYDYSAVQNDWLVRRILKHLGDQWAEKPLLFGIATL